MSEHKHDCTVEGQHYSCVCDCGWIWPNPEEPAVAPATKVPRQRACDSCEDVHCQTTSAEEQIAELTAELERAEHGVMARNYVQQAEQRGFARGVEAAAKWLREQTYRDFGMWFAEKMLRTIPQPPAAEAGSQVATSPAGVKTHGELLHDALTQMGFKLAAWEEKSPEERRELERIAGPTGPARGVSSR